MGAYSYFVDRDPGAAPPDARDLCPDAAVVGGGPAGALAARQLAGFGLRVVLVHAARRRRQHLGESLSASAPRLLASYGLELPPSSFAPRPGDHFVRWGGREQRIAVRPEDGAGEGQRLIRRDRLDAWALAEARRAGVRILAGTASREGGSRASGAALVVRRRGARPLRIVARAVVDASGRNGALTRHSRRWPDYRTTALTAHLAPGEREGTLIESFADGWVWSAPVLDGRRDVTVMLDSEDAAGGAEDRFREAIRQVDLGGFVGSDLLAPVRAADVTPYAAAPVAPDGAPQIAVGDAASALDPLAGLGTMKAMDSGLTGAVVLRTVLERSPEAAVALDFHARKERGLAAETDERIAGFYAEESRFAERPFWRRRSRAAPPPKTLPALEADSRLVPAPGVRVERAGVLRGDWIVAAEALSGPGRHRPAHRFGRIPLPELFRTASTAGSVRQTLAEFPASEDETRAALGWLVGEGFLRPAASAPASGTGP